MSFLHKNRFPTPESEFSTWFSTLVENLLVIIYFCTVFPLLSAPFALMGSFIRVEREKDKGVEK